MPGACLPQADTTYLNPLYFFNEVPADGDESLLWPCMKPVNSCVVNYGWELPGSNAQSVTNR